MKVTDDDVLRTIRDFHHVWGFSPTVRELGNLLELRSSSSVWFRLRRLRAEGKVEWIPGSPRTLQVRER